MLRDILSKFAFIPLFALLVAFAGCGGSGGSGSMTVELTDAPIDSADAVNVRILRVEVNQAGSPEGWITLNEVNETFDLLELANGASAVIATQELDAGTYPQMRLILSQDGHSVVIDGQSYEMFVPSGAQTGVKLNINATIEEDIEYTILLDFDASRSVVEAGANDQVPYLLQPVIKAVDKAITGNIEGTVDPASTEPLVYAIAGSDTSATTVANDSTGYFKLTGLEAGTYDVVIDPRNDNYLKETIQDVSVTVEETNSLGTIQLSSN